MTAARSPCRCFKTRVLHFKVKNTPLKDKKWKEKVQKNAQLSFCGGREAFHQEIVLRGIQPCFFSRRSAWSVLKCNHFAKFSGTFWTLWTRKLRFWWGILVSIFKSLTDVLYIFLLCAKEKSQNAPLFEMDFVLNFAMCSTDFPYANGSTIRIVLCEWL